MSESGTAPVDIGGRSRTRRQSILSDFLPESLPFTASLVATSPIAREILSKDIECCTSEEDENATDDGHSSDADSESSQAHVPDVQLAFHPNGVAYGCGYSTIPLQDQDRPVPNSHELEEAFQEELNLLRDNHILPPKPARGWKIISLVRLYRSVFGSKNRRQKRPSFSRQSFDETTPLFISDSEDQFESTPPTPEPEEVFQRWEEAVAAQRIKTTWQHETKTLVQYAAPLIVTFLLHYSVTIGSVLTVGQLGMEELAAVNLATMTASITCYVPVQGLATCLDTLCAQAYGSGHKHLVGLQAQRMTWILWMLMLPIAFLWWFSEPILAALVPGGSTAHLAALYLRILIIGMPGVAAFESGKRFVQSQGLFKATTYTLLIGAPLSFLQNWLFVFKLGWNFSGAATAMGITQNLLPLLLALYVCLVDGAQCWKGFSMKAFTSWGPMMRLAFPGMVMIEAQFSVLEILTIAAGRFGTASLAAQSILVTVTSTSFNIPFPLAIATSTRVANLIGARLSGAARTTAKVATIAACVVGIFNMTIFVALRRQLPRVFTNNEEVIDIVSNVILVCAVMQIFDALAAVSHGILRGIGRQAIGGFTNLFSYYLVALPISLSTGFALDWKLSGLWVGQAIGLAVVSGLELLYLHRVDWEIAVAQAEARMNSEVTVVEGKVCHGGN